MTLEEEFGQVFPQDWTDKGISRREILAFLREKVDEARTQRDKEILEKLEGMRKPDADKKYDVYSEQRRIAYNQALDDIKNYLSPAE